MGNLRIFNCLILCYCVFSIKCQLTINQDIENRIIGESLPLILKFLNDDVGATISYNTGKIKQTQLKGDILEVDITASVSCKSPSEQCNYESADCRGLLFVKPNVELQVLSVDCNTNLPIEEPIALPVQEKPCEGCLVDIDVNGKGVEQLAKNIIQHVESEKGKKYELIEIVRVQTEVTNGVNFFLTVLIGRPPHSCKDQICVRDTTEDMYCLVKFFQEPGYYSPKNIISNNCTQTQTFIPMIPNNINLIDSGDKKIKYNDKDLYQKKSELSENDILKEIISQILPFDDSESKLTKNVQTDEQNVAKTVESSSANNLPDGSSPSVIASSTFQEVLATEDEPISVGTDTAVDLSVVENNLGPSTDTIVKGSSTVDVVEQMSVDQGSTKVEVTSESVGLEDIKVVPSTDNPSTSNQRRKRSLLGGKKPIDVNNPTIQEYLGEAVNHLNEKLTEGDSQLKVGKVISATSQVVSGVSYDIKAELTDCSTGENSIVNCQQEPKICDINVWYRPWLSSRIIKINCGGETYSFNALSEKNRKKRETLVGGHNPLSNDDPRISKHLQKLLPQLDSVSDKGHKLKIKKVLSATSQVVAGTNWNIKAIVALSDCDKSDQKTSSDCGDNKGSYETICKFKFWEKLPDENGERKLEEVKIDCEDSKLNFRSKREIHRRKSRETLIGGHNPLSNDDPRVSKHLQKLLPQLDSVSDKGHKLKIKKILSATSQVVAGTNWNIKAIVALSDCDKSDQKTSSDCGDNKESYETICKFKFWEKLPDENGERKLEEVKIDCDDSKLNLKSKRDIHRRKRETLIGGHNPLSNDDPRISKHLQKLLPQLDSVSDKGHKLKIKKVLSATSQVVAGTNWNIKAIVALSDCDKSDKKTSSDCGNNKESYETICKFKFWEKLPDQNGERKLEEVKIDCEDSKLNLRSKRDIHRRKRETLIGGHNPLSNDDPRISKHLQNLLPQLDSVSDKGHKLKIKKVLSATSQVVAGTNWNIKAIVGLSDCDKSDQKTSSDCGDNKESYETICKFKFWEKLPDQNGERKLEEVKIDCDDSKLNLKSKRDIHRRKRETLIGGHNPLSTDDPRVSKHLQKLLPQLDSISDKQHKLKIKKILSVTSQVVAGTNWNIKAIVSLSDCEKLDEKTSSDCGSNKESYETVCKFKFWEKLPDATGERKLEEVKIDCDDPKLNFRSKRDTGSSRFKREDKIKGGLKSVDKTDPEIYKFLSAGLQYMDLNSPHDNKFKVKEILSATRQVVAGNLWRIKVTLVLSDCDKTDSTEWDQCGDLEGSEPKYCTVQIWDRPWIQHGRETNITCDDQKHSYSFRSKRSDLTSQLREFRKFEKTYNKSYDTIEERVQRFQIFQDNMEQVKLLNDLEQGTAVYGPTIFADLTKKEFSRLLGYRTDLKNENEIEFMKAEIPDVELPDSFDWRDKNVVTKVKNQGSCGSCWAFSVTGNVEGQYAIKNGKLLSFSEQELVDCDTVDQGCNGGLMDNAYRQIEKLGGLEEEQEYPYEAEDEKCHFNKALVRVELSGAVNISQDETEMAKWLVKNGPISIAINANAMQFYMGGVSHPWKMLCNPKSLDHGVLIVGYGVHTYPKFKKSLPYWIVKNSWGPSWGEQGYYRVYRGDGTCGVNQTPSSAILK